MSEAKKPGIRIGLLLTIINGKFTEAIWHEALAIAAAEGFSLLMYPVEMLGGDGPDRKHNALFFLAREAPVDGWVVAGSVFNLAGRAAALERLHELGSAPLAVVCDELPGVACATVDNGAGMRDIVRHLAEVHSRSRIAFVRGPSRSTDAAEREAGYREGLERSGLPFDPARVADGDFLRPSGAAAVRELLARPGPRPDAICFANDAMAMGGFEALRAAGLRVPEDVLVTGFDDTEDARFAPVPLTSASQSLGALTREAFGEVLERLAGRGRESIPLAKLRIRYRASCGCAPAGNGPEPPEGAEEEGWDAARAAEVEGWAKAAAGALLAGAGAKEAFAALSRLAASLAEAGAEPWPLQARLSVLRRDLAPALGGPRIDAFVDQSQAMVLERFRAAEARRRFAVERAAMEATRSSHALASATSLEGLLEVLERELPALGVEDACLSLYEGGAGPGAALPAGSKAVLALRAGKRVPLAPGGEAFATARILPPSMGTLGGGPLMVQPLYFRDLHIGLLVHGAKRGGAALYESLRIQCSSALRGIMLSADRDRAEERLVEANRKLLAANAQLVELNLVKNDFVANVSHEIRTPLTLLSGPLDAIIAGEYGSELGAGARVFRSMRANADRLMRMVNSFLDFAKIQAGKMRAAKATEDVSALLASYAASAAHAAQARGLRFEAEDATGGLTAEIDRDLFDKAALNLISNAFKFTPRGGRVGVRLERRPAGRFALVVEDSGIGIEKAMVRRVFERFTQADSSSDREYGGTGIGLSLVKDIADLHGGQVLAESEVDRGSRFTLELPVGNPAGEPAKPSGPSRWLLSDLEPPAAAGPSPGDAGAEGKPLVIAVDDNAEMLDYLGTVLGEDYRVAKARSGREALELARAEPPDLAVSDLMMPGMDGREFVAAVRADPALAGTPVILLTARAEADARVSGLEAGADDYLQKPFDARELRARARACVAMKRMRESLETRNASLEDLVREQIAALEGEKQEALRLGRTIQKHFEEFLFALASAIESKDTYTGGHVERVARYARDLANKAGLSAEEARDAWLGAIVHDVGKIGVRDSVLNKPGPLDRAELAEMKSHAEIGYRVLGRIEDIGKVALVALHHQERWDGTGYPRGLSGEAIPLAARIVTVADYWDGIVTDRPYRAALPLSRAIEVMRSERGKGLEPRLHDLFMEEDDGIFLRYMSS